MKVWLPLHAKQADNTATFLHGNRMPRCCNAFISTAGKEQENVIRLILFQVVSEANARNMQGLTSPQALDSIFLISTRHY